MVIIGQDPTSSGRKQRVMIDVRSYTLSNGCRILFRPTPDKEILSIRANVLWGGRDDAPERAGLSNLMARLLTKGTQTRTALQIAEELESVGGSIDSYCDYDALGLTTQTVADDWSLALEILTDCLFHPVFDPIEFDKERSMIQADILRDEDEKLSFSYKNLQRLLYQGHLYSLPPEGELKTIDALERDFVTALHGEAVRPERMLLVVVGNAPEQEFVAQMEKTWPPKSDQPLRDRRQAEANPGEGQGKNLELRKDVEQGFIVVGYLAPKPGTPENTALRVACGILGEGMSARMFARLRDRDHLAYAVGSLLASRELASHLALYIGTKPDKVKMALEGMLREAQGIFDEPPTPEEIDRAKRYILGKYLIARQTNHALALSMSANEISGLGWEWGEHFPERIHAVTPQAALEAARAYIAQPTIVTLEPRK